MNVLGLSISATVAAIAVIVALLVIIGVVGWWARRKPSTLDIAYFKRRWQEAQTLCAREDTWPLAIINADKLLDEALKKSKYRGKTMGERLVSAQHDISNNDLVWFAHKLRNKLVHEDLKKLKKKDVLEALVGFREALKDLGALK
jgi:hypothetical protein